MKETDLQTNPQINRYLNIVMVTREENDRIQIWFRLGRGAEKAQKR
jgi:hypothetical protein